MSICNVLGRKAVKKRTSSPIVVIMDPCGCTHFETRREKCSSSKEQQIKGCKKMGKFTLSILLLLMRRKNTSSRRFPSLFFSLFYDFSFWHIKVSAFSSLCLLLLSILRQKNESRNLDTVMEKESSTKNITDGLFYKESFFHELFGRYF